MLLLISCISFISIMFLFLLGWISEGFAPWPHLVVVVFVNISLHS